MGDGEARRWKIPRKRIIRPGRLPPRCAAMAVARRVIAHLDDELASMIAAGDARINMAPDGRGLSNPRKVGWAFWVIVDDEADHERAGQEVFGTNYVLWDLSWQ